MGYQTFDIDVGNTLMFAVQFQDVSTDSDISVKKLVSYENPVGGAKLTTGTDQIWTYKAGEGWLKYFWYVGKGGIGNYWAAEDTTTEISDNIKVAAGDSFFFVRSDGSKATPAKLNVAGGIVDLKSKRAFSVTVADTILLCNPWPTAIRIKDFVGYYPNPVGGAKITTGTDQLWTYRNGVWAKYFWYVGKGGVGNYWAAEDTTTEVDDKLTIEPGEGFFFVRSDGSKATDVAITFKGPDYKEP